LLLPGAPSHLKSFWMNIDLYNFKNKPYDIS